MGFWDSLKSFGKSAGSALSGAGLGAAIGSIGGNILSYHENKKLAQEQRDWQERMSNTAHQREVNDLLAAGLNPVLSANSGASVGAGSAGNVSTSDFGATINNSRALKMQQELQKSTIAKTEAEADYLREQAIKTDYETSNIVDIGAQKRYEYNYLLPLQAMKIEQDILNSKAITAAQVDLMANQSGFYKNNASAIHYGLPYKKLESDFYNSGYGRTLYYIDKTTNSAKGAGDAIMSFIPKPGKIDNSKKYFDYSGDRYIEY